jgi:hypothetical protein
VSSSDRAEDGASSHPRVFWIREWRTGGVVHFRIGRAGADLVAEWVGIAELRARRSGDCARFVFRSDVGEDRANKIRRGAAEALLRHLRGRLSLHASSAARNGHAILFLGDSDSGKSTTVAQLCRGHGFALLADDIAFLDESAAQIDVVPGEAIHWLCADAAAFLGAPVGDDLKTGLPAVRLATGAARLSLTVKLVFDDSVRYPEARRIHGEGAFLALGQGMLRFALDDPAVDLRDFDMLARTHMTAPMYEVRRPRSLAALRDVVELVFALGEKAGGGSGGD